MFLRSCFFFKMVVLWFDSSQFFNGLDTGKLNIIWFIVVFIIFFHNDHFGLCLWIKLLRYWQVYDVSIGVGSSFNELIFVMNRQTDGYNIIRSEFVEVSEWIRDTNIDRLDGGGTMTQISMQLLQLQSTF